MFILNLTYSLLTSPQETNTRHFFLRGLYVSMYCRFSLTSLSVSIFSILDLAHVHCSLLLRCIPRRNGKKSYLGRPSYLFAVKEVADLCGWFNFGLLALCH